MNTAMPRPKIDIAARPRSLMILRSWPAVSSLIKNDAAIIRTANTTMV